LDHRDDDVETALIADLQEAFDSCSFRAEPASWRGSSSGRMGTTLLGAATSELGGRRLGDFQLLYEIGRGGMGVVYRARQVSLDRDVALKLLPTLSSSSPSRVRRFRTESLAVARLAHPNVIPVIAHGEEEGLLYYAMELLDGTSLDSAIHGNPSLLRSTFLRNGSTGIANRDTADRTIAREKTTSGPEVPAWRSIREYRHLARLLAEVAEGLAHAHAHGVVHRDIKPQNLLLGGDGRLRISDFGLALLTDEPHMTVTGEVMGTPAYLAPEQVRGAPGAIDQRTDVYALGATLYELLTGRRPFRGETRDQVLHQIVEREPESPRRVERTIPRDLETICLRAMAKDPSDRYATAGVLAEDLRRFSDARPVLAARVGRIRKIRLWAGRHKGAALAIVAVIVLVAVAAGLASSIRSSRRAEAARLLNQAYDQLVYQDYRNAEPAFDDVARAEALGAEELALARVRALALLGASQNRKAVEVLDHALESYPGDRRLMYLLAWAQWRIHQRDACRATFADAEEMPGDLDSDEWFLRGLAIHFDDATEAIDSYTHAIAQRVADHRFHPQAALHLARASNQHMYSTRTVDGWADAESSLKELIRYGQYGAYPYYLLSITHRLVAEILLQADPPRDEEQAWAHLDHALARAIEGQAIDSTDDRPVTAEAECLERMGRFEDALEARTRALAVADTSDERCEAHHYRWRLHYWLGQPDEALADVEAHRACVPDSPFYAHVYPALVHADLGDLETAVTHARALAEESPTDPLMVIWSVSTLRLLGELDEADALLDLGLDQPATSGAPAHHPDGWLAALHDYVSGEGDWDTLSAMIEAYDSPRKLRGEAHFHAGVMSLAKGLRQEAEEHFERAVQAADGALGYAFHAGVVLERLRLEPGWPTWMDSSLFQSEAEPSGTDGTVHHAGAAALLGEDRRD
jgi:serine/threonine protein kinase